MNDIQDFFVVYPWQWRTTQNKRYTYGVLKSTKHVPLTVSDTEKVPSNDSLRSIASFCSLFGHSSRVATQYSQFSVSKSALLNKHDFSVDGNVSFAGTNPSALYAEILFLFNSFLIAGKRTIDLMETTLKNHYSRQSYSAWKQLSSMLYDKRLDYALCYDFRNCIEHETALISIVNIDEQSSMAGFAINIDSGLLDSKLKNSTKKRLVKFAIERKSNGESPWLSLGQVISAYTKLITILYILFQTIVRKELTKQREYYTNGLSDAPRGANCVIEHAEEYKTTGYIPASRVCRFEEISIVADIDIEIKSLYRSYDLDSFEQSMASMTD